MKRLIEKIEDIDLRVDCFVKMGEMRLAYFCVAKRGRAGVPKMRELLDLGKSGLLQNCDDLVPIIERWLKQNSSALSGATLEKLF